MGTHAFVATLFLCALIAEWGSHNIAFLHHAGTGSGLVAVGKKAGGHDDPCGVVVCHECRRSDPAPPKNISHEVPPCGTIAGLIEPDRGVSRIQGQLAIPRGDARRLFRAVDPPNLPPELS